MQLTRMASEVQKRQQKGLKVALCHGCFDIFHFGHLRHLEAARSLVDCLVVTVTPDRFVNKGPDRPVFSEKHRAEVIAGLQAVDWVAINQWKSAVETIGVVRPNVFIKGQEYETRAMQVNPQFLEEASAVREIGGEIAFTNEEVSSSTAVFKRLFLAL